MRKHTRSVYNIKKTLLSYREKKNLHNNYYLLYKKYIVEKRTKDKARLSVKYFNFNK